MWRSASRGFTLLELIVEQSRVPVVVDAGLGAPSHAAEAMELGADAVLVNTAIGTAGDGVNPGKDVEYCFKSADKKLTFCPDALAATKPDEPQAPEHPYPCCGGRMIIIETFKRGSTPRYRPTGPMVAIRIDTS